MDKRKVKVTSLEYVLKDRDANKVVAGVNHDFRPFQQLTKEQFHGATRIAVTLTVEEPLTPGQVLQALFDDANNAALLAVMGFDEKLDSWDYVAQQLMNQGWDPNRAT